MTRWEARAVLGLALLGLTAGLTWWLGPLGLIAPCVVLLVTVLFVLDVETAVDGGEAVEEPSRPGRHPVQHRRVRR